MNCYVYRRDAEFGKDSSIIARISSFDLPVKRNRKGLYKLQPDERSVYTCMTSDFLVEEADEWRPEAWKMIWERGDLHFVIIKMCIRDRSKVSLEWTQNTLQDYLLQRDTEGRGSAIS